MFSSEQVVISKFRSELVLT